MDLSGTEYISTPNNNETCRLCLRKNSILSPIFTNPLSSKIMSLVPIEMREGDGLPAMICKQCCRQVDRSYKFRLICLNSDVTLRQYLKTIYVTGSPKSPLTNRPNTEVIYCEPETLLQHNHYPADQECRPSSPTIHPSPQAAQVTKPTVVNENNENVVHRPVHIVCNVKYSDGRILPVSVTYPKIVRQPSEKLPVQKKKIAEKPRFTPCLPEVIKIVKPKSVSFIPASFTCKMCSVSFSKREHLKSHQIIHKGEKPFLCEECGKSFARKQELDVHMGHHSGVHPYSCATCNKFFHSYSGYKSHEDGHNGVKPFLCIICGKTFAQKTSMTNHERVHSQEKPFSCPVCDKRFTTNTNLITHKKRHTGIIEFSCRTCSKAFLTKSGLERHELVHAGLKAFSCEICSLSFYTKTEVKRHMRYHTGEKRFNCNICFKSFRESQHLIIHQRIHTGERPYLCTLCTKSFYSSSKLSRHIKTHNRNGC